jgi:SAM-dependent methyltransferase
MVPPKLLKRLQLWRYAGDTYECPCCATTFSALWPSGETADSVRENSMCPNCGSLERHRLLWLYINAHPEMLFDGARVLHVAPETIIAELLRRMAAIDYVGADAEQGRAAVQMDLTAIDEPDASFDAIVCYHVLEHIADDGLAMRELRRVLKPGGWALLQSPLRLDLEHTYEDWTITSPIERERAFGQRDHVRLYGRDYGARLEDAGWRVDRVDFVSTLPDALATRYAIDPAEELYLCR